MSDSKGERRVNESPRTPGFAAKSRAPGWIGPCSRIARKMNLRSGVAAALVSLAWTTLGSNALAQDTDDEDAAAESAPTAAPPSTVQVVPVPTYTGTAGAEDVVVLKDGGAIRGLLMEVLPNNRVSVKLADGRTAIIPWVLVHHIEQGSHPATTQPQTSTTPKPDTSSAPLAPITGSAFVHLAGDEATLQMEQGGTWVNVCASPCDRELPLEPGYRIDGSNVRTSNVFHLLAKPGERVTLHVDTASSAGFSGGVTMAVLGGLTATVGFWGWYITILNNATETYDYSTDSYVSHKHISPVPWAITTGIGAAVGTVGLVMAIANEKTKVNEQSGIPSAKDASRTPLPERAPTWANPKLAGFPSAPQTTPILSLRF